jgi:hypothetical protein
MNDNMDDLIEKGMIQEENKKTEKDLQKLCKSFIKGQGSIYILEDGNRVQTANGVTENGPSYVEHAWNPRTLSKTGVAQLLKSQGGDHAIYPKVQEYAITIAVSSSLIEDSTLAKYQSHDFPTVTFKENSNGNIYIVNGHHRIAAWKAVHRGLLEKLHENRQILKGDLSVANDHDTPATIAARELVDQLEKKLLIEGGWGAVILDYGMYNSNIQQIGE